MTSEVGDGSDPVARAESSLTLVARWLTDVVGEGAIFTKQGLRAALPQFEQVDRRMRDLRAYGWRIDTNREDARLEPSELRLVETGEQPGTPEFLAVSANRITSRERLAAFSQSGFRCQMCGVQVGDRNESDSGFARLRAIRVVGEPTVVCTECAPATTAQVSTDIELFKTRLVKLSREERVRLRERINEGESQTRIESAVSLAARLPRSVVLECLDDAVAESTRFSTRRDSIGHE